MSGSIVNTYNLKVKLQNLDPRNPVSVKRRFGFVVLVQAVWTAPTKHTM